jgi:hypothetical protein
VVRQRGHRLGRGWSVGWQVVLEEKEMTDESDSKAAVRPDGHIGMTGVVRLCDCNTPCL